MSSLTLEDCPVAPLPSIISSAELDLVQAGTEWAVKVNYIEIPTLSLCISLVRDDREMTVLEKFIYRWQRDRDELSAEWRDDLSKVIGEAVSDATSNTTETTA